MSLSGYGNEYRLVMSLEKTLTFDSIDSTSSPILLKKFKKKKKIELFGRIAFNGEDNTAV